MKSMPRFANLSTRVSRSIPGLVLLFMIPSALLAQEALPWLAAVGGDRTIIHTIQAEASVQVSDGLEFTVKTLYHDPQRAVFHQIYSNRTATYGIEGRYLWMHEGENESEGPGFLEMFVLGHQLHAQILFFDSLHPTLRGEEPAEFNGVSCRKLRGEGGAIPWDMYFDDRGNPLGMDLVRPSEPVIRNVFSDWRLVEGVLLPHAIEIDDGERLFQYTFTGIEFNQGALADYRASGATPEQELLRLHRLGMDAHWFGDMEAYKRVFADSMVIVSRGEVLPSSGGQVGDMLDGVVASRDYTVYDDLVRPTVELSPDGELGWVIAQIGARGRMLNDSAEAFEFTCAWIETYKKVAGEWKLTGNVSNFKP